MAPMIEATQLSPDAITEAPKITPDTDITKHASHGDGTVNPIQQNIHVDWTPAEERRAVRKVDFCILPIVMLGFFSLQVDRGNISSALTSGLRHDINITQDIINNGQTILYASIIAGEIPSNLLLQRIGAKWWLPFQMLFWGFVATIQITMKNATGFYICRCFLGLAESGFIPGGVYYISTFYTRRQFAARVGLFWIGNYIGKGCSGLMAAGIFSIKNDSYTTWQWLFMIEGVIALFIGAVALAFLPRSTEDARTLIPGFHMLTKRERHILTTRLLLRYDGHCMGNTQRSYPNAEKRTFGYQAIGGQMFRGYDAPRYLNGLIAVLSLQCFSMLLVGVAIFIFWYSNKNNLGEQASQTYVLKLISSGTRL